MKKVLLAGETWFKHTTHVKGFDTFTDSTFGNGAGWLIRALEKGGYEVTHIHNHLAGFDFPYTMDELSKYDLVILSDIGSNTLLIPEDTFQQSKKNPNRTDLIKQYVLNGGSFLMIGGYMAFSGIDATSRYGQTAIKDILPVQCLDIDDRQEHPEGIQPAITVEHEIFDGITSEWPSFLGYNKTIVLDRGEVLATIGGDPFIVVGNFKQGKSAVFTSDCAPHWGPIEFVEWENYDKFWCNLADYLTK